MSDTKPDEIIQAENLIKTGKSEEALEIVRKFQLSAWSYFFKQDSDKALEIALMSKILIEKIDKRIDIAENLFLLGHSCIQKGERNKGLECALKSLAIQEGLKNRPGIARSLSLVGLAYNYKGQLDRSIKFFNRSLSIKEIDNTTKVTALQNLGLMYFIKRQLEKALKYNERGAKLAKEMKLYRPYAIMLFQLGYIFVIETNGENIILIESVDSYSICYLFKGQSYPAKQKLVSLIKEIQNAPTIWQTLYKFFKTSEVADLQDLPQIENLIKEIFIT